MIGKRRIAEIPTLPVAELARGVLLLTLVLAVMPGIGWAEGSADGEASLFRLIIKPGVVETLVYAFVAVFCLAEAILVGLWIRNARSLSRILREVRVISRDKFRDEYINLGGKLRGTQMARVKHAWDEFMESLFPEKGTLYNTMPPEHFFNSDKLGMGFVFYRKIPSYFVGVGLLLTFWGLAAALDFAVDGIPQENSANQSQEMFQQQLKKTQDAMRNLLAAAAVKFTTSIAGLFFSILLGLSVESVRRSISTLCAQICRELESRVRFAVLETTAINQLEQLKEQTVQLKRFNTELAVSIADALEPRIQASVSGALAKSGLVAMPAQVTSANEKLDTQTGELQKMNREVAGNIAREIAGPVQEGVAKAMGPLSESIQGFARNMKDANKEGIQEITRGIPEQMQNAANTINSAQQAISGVATELQNVAKNLSGQIGEAGGKFEANMGDASAAVGGIVSDVGREIAGLKELVRGLGEMLAGQRQEFEALAKTTRGAAVGAAQEAISGVAGELHTASVGLTSQIGEAGGKFGQEIDKASQAVGGAVSGIRVEVATLKGVVSGFSEILGRQLEDFETLAKATQGAADSLSNAAVQHAQAAQPIASAASQISAAAETIRNLSETVQSTHESLRSIHEQIGESSTQLRRFWEQHDERFEGVDEKLASIVRDIMEGNDAYRENVDRFVNGIAESLKGALGQLSAAIRDLEERIGDLEEEKDSPRRS